MIDNGYNKHLIIKMALLDKRSWFIKTFSVRYDWADVLKLAKAHAAIADLAVKGKIESIWLEYWPVMCLNQPPAELFLGGNGDPVFPKDVYSLSSPCGYVSTPR